MRTRAYAGTPQRLEIGSSWANAITSVFKDSIILMTSTDPSRPLALTYTRDPKGHVVSQHLVEIANTVHPSTGSGGNMDQFVFYPVQLNIRKLTPRECLRLMDVDDCYIDRMMAAVDDKGKRKLTKTALYKCAGNSIVVACLEGLFENMFIGKEEGLEAHLKPSFETPYQLTLF